MKKKCLLLTFLLCLTFTGFNFSQDCKNTRPTFGSLYPDPFSVPKRTTFILGNRHPEQVYQIFASCLEAYVQMLIDLDFEVVYYFWTRPFLVEDKPCPDEEGEAYRMIKDSTIQRCLTISGSGLKMLWRNVISKMAVVPKATFMPLEGVGEALAVVMTMPR